MLLCCNTLWSSIEHGNFALIVSWHVMKISRQYKWGKMGSHGSRWRRRGSRMSLRRGRWKYECVNVMWVEWDDEGVAHRKSVGRVFASFWDGDEVEREEVEVRLG